MPVPRIDAMMYGGSGKTCSKFRRKKTRADLIFVLEVLLLTGTPGFGTRHKRRRPALPCISPRLAGTRRAISTDCATLPYFSLWLAATSRASRRFSCGDRVSENIGTKLAFPPFLELDQYDECCSYLLYRSAASAPCISTNSRNREVETTSETSYCGREELTNAGSGAPLKAWLYCIRTSRVYVVGFPAVVASDLRGNGRRPRLFGNKIITRAVHAENELTCNAGKSFLGTSCATDSRTELFCRLNGDGLPPETGC